MINTSSVVSSNAPSAANTFGSVCFETLSCQTLNVPLLTPLVSVIVAINNIVAFVGKTSWGFASTLSVKGAIVSDSKVPAEVSGVIVLPARSFAPETVILPVASSWSFSKVKVPVQVVSE